MLEKERGGGRFKLITSSESSCLCLSPLSHRERGKKKRKYSPHFRVCDLTSFLFLLVRESELERGTRYFFRLFRFVVVEFESIRRRKTCTKMGWFLSIPPPSSSLSESFQLFLKWPARRPVDDGNKKMTTWRHQFFLLSDLQTLGRWTFFFCSLLFYGCGSSGFLYLFLLMLLLFFENIINLKKQTKKRNTKNGRR